MHFLCSAPLRFIFVLLAFAMQTIKEVNWVESTRFSCRLAQFLYFKFEERR